MLKSLHQIKTECGSFSEFSDSDSVRGITPLFQSIVFYVAQVTPLWRYNCVTGWLLFFQVCPPISWVPHYPQCLQETYGWTDASVVLILFRLWELGRVLSFVYSLWNTLLFQLVGSCLYIFSFMHFLHLFFLTYIISCTCTVLWLELLSHSKVCSMMHWRDKCFFLNFLDQKHVFQAD